MAYLHVFYLFFFFFSLEGFYLHTYKRFIFFKKSSKTPTNNSTHSYILFNSVSSFNTLLAPWEMPKLYFQQLKPEREKNVNYMYFKNHHFVKIILLPQDMSHKTYDFITYTEQ